MGIPGYCIDAAHMLLPKTSKFLVVFWPSLSLNRTIHPPRWNFFTEHLTLEGEFNLDSVIQEMQQSDALGEEALDAFDVPVDIG